MSIQISLSFEGLLLTAVCSYADTVHGFQFLCILACTDCSLILSLPFLRGVRWHLIMNVLNVSLMSDTKYLLRFLLEKCLFHTFPYLSRLFVFWTLPVSFSSILSCSIFFCLCIAFSPRSCWVYRFVPKQKFYILIQSVYLLLFLALLSQGFHASPFPWSAFSSCFAWWILKLRSESYLKGKIRKNTVFRGIIFS